jgi:hypothetical protein
MRKPEKVSPNAPTYAHITGVAPGICMHCVHIRGVNRGYVSRSYCAKAVELARQSGPGRTIDPSTVGCKYWELKL